MRVGAGFLTYQQGVAADGDFERIMARRAGEAGFHAVWFSEHHFAPDGYLPSAVPAMADVLARTNRIGVGVGVALLPFHDIPRLDAGLRGLERFGRPVVYAAAVGYRDEEFDGFGVRRRDRGRLFEARLGELVTRLRARNSAVELWVGAVAGAAVDRAARFGLPVLFPPGSSPEELRRRIQRYRSVAGRPGAFGVVRDVVLGGERPSDVEETVERLVVPMYRDYLHRMVVSTPHGPRWGEALGSADTAAYYARMRATMLAGEGPVVETELDRLDALGIDLVVLRCWYPGSSRDEGLRALDRLTSAVAPRLAQGRS
ncbi:MAG: LLM class flavin-dependent oxidoreductase [Micromonosporaceae bacterium]|nr:LLM class flavin-dependent oxidoreductase [Micromonosporaceae bacterium]